MKRKLDYIIQEDNDERLIFRFYPRQSHCHSYNNEPPKTLEQVYKVYYSYSIIKQYKFNSEDQWESKVLFSEPCDECSVIDEIGNACSYLAKGETNVTIDNNHYTVEFLDEPFIPMGIGTNWTIHKDIWDVSIILYTFTLFKWNNVGYKFKLIQDEVESFGKYLLNCCDYMLKHGEPI